MATDESKSFTPIKDLSQQQQNTAINQQTTSMPPTSADIAKLSHILRVRLRLATVKAERGWEYLSLSETEERLLLPTAAAAATSNNNDYIDESAELTSSIYSAFKRLAKDTEAEDEQKRSAIDMDKAITSISTKIHDKHVNDTTKHIGPPNRVYSSAKANERRRQRQKRQLIHRPYERQRSKSPSLVEAALSSSPSSSSWPPHHYIAHTITNDYDSNDDYELNEDGNNNTEDITKGRKSAFKQTAEHSAQYYAVYNRLSADNEATHQFNTMNNQLSTKSNTISTITKAMITPSSSQECEVQMNNRSIHSTNSAATSSTSSVSPPPAAAAATMARVSPRRPDFSLGRLPTRLADPTGTTPPTSPDTEQAARLMIMLANSHDTGKEQTDMTRSNL
ncbi:hypothetical protein BDF19DRAFT_421465 [Syncephalis fuscata]|nr:hypothetical protein BDF19DRAFT_421465 [Syncephalis fuscata]